MDSGKQADGCLVMRPLTDNGGYIDNCTVTVTLLLLRVRLRLWVGLGPGGGGLCQDGGILVLHCLCVGELMTSGGRH